MTGVAFGGRTVWIWQREFWAEQARRRAYRREHPPYNSRRARQARADAALARAWRPYPGRMTVGTSDTYRGRSRTVTYDAGRVVRVQSTRERSRGMDGLRPRERPVRSR